MQALKVTDPLVVLLFTFVAGGEAGVEDEVQQEVRDPADDGHSGHDGLLVLHHVQASEG
jgi:hypothetical protein